VSTYQAITGKADWDTLADVQQQVKNLKVMARAAENKVLYWDRPYKSDSIYPMGYDDNSGDRSSTQRTRNVFEYDPNDKYQSHIDFSNPFYSQGLGPKDYSGKNIRYRVADEKKFWDATLKKFQNREQTLLGVEAAGGWDAYNKQATDRAEAAVPHSESLRASELTRPVGGGGGGGGGGSLGSSRHVSAARRAEGPRGAAPSRRGTVARKRLRAASMLGQPLGGGSQSAAQLLG
jgi:hypothetical protein